MTKFVFKITQVIDWLTLGFKMIISLKHKSEKHNFKNRKGFVHMTMNLISEVMVYNSYSRLTADSDAK